MKSIETLAVVIARSASDEAIQYLNLDCFASLAMTEPRQSSRSNDQFVAGGATRSGDWLLRFNPAATKPLFFISSMKSRT